LPHANLILLGASHHTTPLEVREKLAIDDARLGDLAARLRVTPGVREFAVLNTCNRVELYGVTQDPAAAQGLRQALVDVTGCAPSDLARAVVQRENDEAIAHLFEVASGLDSQIVGEAEILGQVKDAYDRALAGRWTGPVLNRVFQKAFQAAKY